MNDIAEDLKDISIVEQRPIIDGGSMVMLLSPETT